MKIDKKASNTFVVQKNQSDCGIACLSSIINFHGGQANFEQLRIESGTTSQGTSLLGLYQTAKKAGFYAEGLQTDIGYLKKIKAPVILHVIVNGQMLHYVVLYKHNSDHFLIGDPGYGLKWITESELISMWTSSTLLELTPNKEQFSFKALQERNKWKWLFEFLKKDFSILNTIFVLGLAVALLSLVTAVFSQVLIDSLIPQRDIAKLVVALLAVTILLLAKSVVGYFRQLLMIKQGFDINIRVTGHFLSNLLQLPVPFFQTRKIGDMIARLNDVGKVQQAVTFLFGELFINVLIMLVALVAVFIYNTWVGSILVFGLPFYGFIAWYYHRRILRQQKDYMIAYANNEGNYINTIRNIIPIKSKGIEGLLSKTGISVFRLFQRKVFQLGKTGSHVQLHMGISGVLISMGIIAVSTWQMLSGLMTTGEFIAVYSLSSSVLPAIGAIAFANVQLQGARVAFERMLEFSDLQKEVDEEIESKKEKLRTFNTLKLKKVTFRYPGKVALFSNISFDLNKGELVTVFGDNGTGKSTIFALLQRFYKPESGSILINDRHIEDYEIKSYRRNISVVPQNVSLLNGTVISNIILNDDEESLKTGLKELEKFRLLPLFNSMPNGLNTILGDGGVQISGGQKQIVGLARAIVQKPQLLLVDELTNHMDRKTKDFVLSLLNDLKNEMAVLSISHNIKQASVSDMIVVLSNEKIEAIGSHSELLMFNNEYSRAWQNILDEKATTF